MLARTDIPAFTDLKFKGNTHINPPGSPSLSIRDGDRGKVDRFGRELAPLVTSGPPGVTGFAGGRPKATEVLGYWPALIPKDRVHPITAVESVESAS